MQDRLSCRVSVFRKQTIGTRQKGRRPRIRSEVPAPLPPTHKHSQDGEKSQNSLQSADRCRSRWLVNRHTQERIGIILPVRADGVNSSKLLGELLRQGVGCRIRDLIDVPLHLFPGPGLGFVLAILQLLDLLDVMPAMSQ